MRGRYSLCAGFDRLRPRLQGPLPPGLAAHYAPRSQVLPGEPLLIQRQENGRLQVGLALWGLLPDWVKDPATAHRCLHARAETVAIKPSFRAAWRHRRCLIPADAFWEQGQWLRRRDGHGLRALEPLLLPWDGGDWQADGAAMSLDQPQL
jgi:putative SOS response-associated peptidase YedK